MRAHRADQVRHEHEAPFEHGNQMNLVPGGIVALDFGGERADPLLNLVGGQQDGRGGHGLGILFLTAARTRGASARASAST